MLATSPCGIGGPTNPEGPCTGTIGQEASNGLGQILGGLSATSVAVSLLVAAAIVAGVLFVRWCATKVGGYFEARDAESKRLEAEERAFKNLRDDYRRNKDYAEFGQKMHEAGEYFDREDDHEEDVEDDEERDDLLEYDREHRS